MKLSYPIAGMVLATALAATSPARAATVSELTRWTAAQSPIGATYSRFATDDVDDSLLSLLAAGGMGALYATGTAVDIRYLGTSSARNASLQWQGLDLFDTRRGCDFATALADEFCLIDSIGLTRRIEGLTPGAAFSLTLQAQTQSLGDASLWRATAESFASLAHARWLVLADGTVLLGFEEGSDGSFDDAVFALTGLSTVAALLSPIPEPTSIALLALGLLLIAARHRPPR
jgi:hypothetical protein